MIVQALPKTINFSEFIDWKPEGTRHELHNGRIIEMNPPLGGHEYIVCFLNTIIAAECFRLNLTYAISKTVLIKPPGAESAYYPDILVLNLPHLENAPLWEKTSTVTQSASIPLIIEVVSTNWKVDYSTKVNDYEDIGVAEYWIVDYLAYGGKRFIGNPKQPTISIYELIEGEYQITQFKGDEGIVSPTFPELNLTANQIFRADVFN